MKLTKNNVKGDTLKKSLKKNVAKSLGVELLENFIKYYKFLTDEEAFAVHKIVIDAKDRFIGKEDGCEDVHRDA